MTWNSEKQCNSLYIYFWLYFPEPISYRLFISQSPESRKEEKNIFHLFTEKQSLKPNKIVHSCVTPAVTFMIPYALLNGVSLSWCSLTERLIKRHDLRLIKAESVIKEIDFNLQGERGEGKRQAGKISAEGTVGTPWLAMQGQGAFYGVSLWQHMGQAEPGPAPKPPARFFAQSHTANPELVFQFKHKRNQHLSSYQLLYLTLFITLVGYVTTEKIWGGCQPGELFSSRMQKKVWDANPFRSTHMELGDALSLRDGAGPPTGTKQP